MWKDAEENGRAQKQAVSRIILEGVKVTMKTLASTTDEPEYRNTSIVVARHSAPKEAIKVQIASGAECLTRN
jgi:hypothetical protein